MGRRPVRLKEWCTRYCPVPAEGDDWSLKGQLPPPSRSTHRNLHACAAIPGKGKARTQILNYVQFPCKLLHEISSMLWYERGAAIPAPTEGVSLTVGRSNPAIGAEGDGESASILVPSRASANGIAAGWVSATTSTLVAEWTAVPGWPSATSGNEEPSPASDSIASCDLSSILGLFVLRSSRSSSSENRWRERVESVSKDHFIVF
nr:hypothetical protein Iba_chr01aCG5680 [Ipomoea batatas]